MADDIKRRRLPTDGLSENKNSDIHILAGQKRKSQLNKASLKTAGGTLLSRITGLLRLIVLAYAIGGSRLADAFNLANNTPNMIHDLVLGGIMAATFVPVLIERSSKCSEEEMRNSISSIISVSIVILVISTLIVELLAPEIISLYTFGAHINPQEKSIAIDLLRFFAPQVLCYGFFGIMASILATKDRFEIVGIAPVTNNIFGIIILLIFSFIMRKTNITQLHISVPELTLLGLGTTLAVASQILVLIPYLKKERFRFRFSINFRDPAIRMIVSLSSWTLGFVLANQLAVFFIMALEVRSGVGGVSAYTYAFTFFQLPFGVIAVSIVNVVTPDFARLYSLKNPRQFANRFSLGARQVMALVIPATIGYLVLAKQVVAVLIGHGQESSTAVHLTASTLVMFALGLPGFCIFFLVIRAFQAMHDTRTAFVLYIIENGLNIITAIFLYKHLGVKGLALSYSIAYSVAALVSLILLRERLGAIGGAKILFRSIESLIYSIIMALTIAFIGALFSTQNHFYEIFILMLQIATGLLIYLGAASAVRSFRIWKNTH